MLRSAKQDLLGNGDVILDVEKRFANLGSNMGSRQLNRKLETGTLTVIKNRITRNSEKLAVISLALMTRRTASRRHSYSASRNGHDRTRRVFCPCKSQKNLQDGKGQFAVEVIFGNPEPSLVILHRGKDIRWGCSTGMDDYHRPVLKSDVTNGRKGQMASDIVPVEHRSGGQAGPARLAWNG